MRVCVCVCGRVRERESFHAMMHLNLFIFFFLFNVVWVRVTGSALIVWTCPDTRLEKRWENPCWRPSTSASLGLVWNKCEYECECEYEWYQKECKEERERERARIIIWWRRRWWWITFELACVCMRVCITHGGGGLCLSVCVCVCVCVVCCTFFYKTATVLLCACVCVCVFNGKSFLVIIIIIISFFPALCCTDLLITHPHPSIHPSIRTRPSVHSVFIRCCRALCGWGASSSQAREDRRRLSQPPRGTPTTRDLHWSHTAQATMQKPEPPCPPLCFEEEELRLCVCKANNNKSA